MPFYPGNERRFRGLRFGPLRALHTLEDVILHGGPVPPSLWRPGDARSPHMHFYPIDYRWQALFSTEIALSH